MTEDGGLISKEYRIAEHSRFTINVNNDVARQHDVSTRIVSDIPVVAERPMYFLYQMSLDEGSDAMGGEQGLLQLVPGGRMHPHRLRAVDMPAESGRAGKPTVVLRFMLENSAVVEHTVKVASGFRVTVRVNDIVGEEHVSTEVMSDEPVVCERPMYATYGGDIQAADTLAGYTFEK